MPAVDLGSNARRYRFRAPPLSGGTPACALRSAFCATSRTASFSSAARGTWRGGSVAVFWDMESASVESVASAGASAAQVASRLREHFAARGAVVDLRAYADRSRLGPRAAEELESRGFVLVNCPEHRLRATGGATVAHRLGVDAIGFAWREAQRARDSLASSSALGLVTGDPGFAHLLGRARDLGVSTILVYPSRQHSELEMLLDAADEAESGPSAWPPSGVRSARRESSGFGALDGDELVGTTAAQTFGDQLVTGHQAAQTSEGDFGDDGVGAGKLKLWGDLDASERAAAGDLGYSAATWDVGALPPESALPWRGLGDTARVAAERLGYSALEWDAELQALSQAATRSLPGCMSGPSSGVVVAAAKAEFAEAFEEDVALGLAGRERLLDAADLRLQTPAAVPAADRHGGSLAALSAEFAEALEDDIELGLVARGPPR